MRQDSDVQLTKVELSALCDVAARAWARRRRGVEEVAFSWSAKRYFVSCKASQMIVSTFGGDAVANRAL